MAQKVELTVFVRTPEAVVFEGNAASVSSWNQQGRFDILTYHENFITLISQYVEVQVGKVTHKWEVSHGVIKAENNTIKIFLGL
ncbi:hypothetical protein HGA88_00450 [Candidatus Roizmanbacteria bacterium]|nr:hypothetical protein [Candidatus Roizmanbacteria bacterium]